MVYNEKKVELLRQRYPEGTRICLDHMEDLCPVESGTCGEVQFVDDAGTLHCKFDNGRTLHLRQTNKNHRIYGGFLLYTRFLHDCVQYLHRTFFLSWVEVRVGVPCH